MDRRYYRSSELSVMFQIVDVRNVSRAGMKGAIARAVFFFLQIETAMAASNEQGFFNP